MFEVGCGEMSGLEGICKWSSQCDCYPSCE